MNTPQKITLADWAQKLLGEHAPHINTLRRWTNEGRIHPQPQKIGKTWFVDPSAKYMSN